MAGLFSKSSRVNNTNPEATYLRVQTALLGRPLAIGCGQIRTAGNVIDYQGFKAQPVKPQGGKGGFGGAGAKGSTGQYQYTVWAMISIGQSQVSEWLALMSGNAIDFLVFPPQQTLNDLTAIGINNPNYGNIGNLTFYYGTSTQSYDPSWQSAFPSHALAYRGEAYAMYPQANLGNSPSFPNITFEILYVLSNDVAALGPDANPCDWIDQLLTNADWGLPGFPSSCIGNFGAGHVGASDPRTYFRATGMLVSVNLSSQTALNSHLNALTKALNCDFRWSSGVLDLIPYGDVEVDANGYVYLPNLTPVYALGVNDFLANQGTLGSALTSGKVSVAFERTNISDVFNKVQVEYLDRANLYNPVTIYSTNEAEISSGKPLRISDLRQNHFFCLASAASTSAGLQLAREMAEINTYQFTLGKQFILLDPMDLVTLTEPALQLSNQLVRITEIQENPDGTLTFTAVEVPGTASAPLYARQSWLGQARNNNAPAPNCNTPVFYEPPDQLGKGLILWIGLSGSIPSQWGGCNVFVATTPDGEYLPVGPFQGQSNMGVLTAPITSVTEAASGATIDNTNVLSVNLTESDGELASGSQSDFAGFYTACAVDSEIIAFLNATLTGANAYNLSPLSRGGYETTIASHASGAPFLRLDGNYFEYPFNASQIGQPLYFKFLAFNPLGGGEQSLDQVGYYIYTPTGAALSSPLPNIDAAWSNYVDGFEYLYWDEVSDFRSGIIYEVRQGPSWNAALLLGVKAHPPFVVPGNGTYWISARCTPVTGLTVYSETPISVTISGNQLSQYLIKSWDEQATDFQGTLSGGMGVDNAGHIGSAALRLGGSQNILTTNPLLESLTTNAGTSAGNAVLHFASVPVGVTKGMSVANQTHGASIPAGVTVSSTTSNSVTLSSKVMSPGVSSGDVIVFSTNDILNAGGIQTNTPGYYEIPESHWIDVGYVANAYVNATSLFTGSPVGQNILAIADFLSQLDVLAGVSTQFIDGWIEIATATAASLDAFGPTDVFPTPDMFTGVPTWGSWQRFTPGVFPGRFFKFRVAMETADPNTDALCLAFKYSVQVAGRIDHYLNQSVPNTGLTITFIPDGVAPVTGVSTAFNAGPNSNNLPLIQVDWQNTAGDTYQITGLSLSQMTLTFFNGGVAVTRAGVTIIAEGY